MSEAGCAEALLRSVERHGPVAVVDIDRGYLSSDAIVVRHNAGVIIQCRPWRMPNGGRFAKEDFRIDMRRGQVTCPNGVVARITRKDSVYFGKACSSCELRSQCTTASQRKLDIHPNEALHIQLRRRAKTRAGRAELRERVQVEHRLARIGTIQGSRARYFTQRKNELDLNRAAAVANLFELHRRAA